MLRRFLNPDPDIATARRLYEAIASRARSPVFYTTLGVADTIDGRFDLLVLHSFLVLDALKRVAGSEGLATHLATVTFAGFEDALRDLGVSDIGLSRRIKAMANAFYGRLDAYATAKDSLTELADAILRNLYRAQTERTADAARMAEYAVAAARHLESPPSRTTLVQGAADFGPLPESDRQ